MVKQNGVVTNGEVSSSELFAARNKLMGQGGGLRPEELDARLLWRVVCILAMRQASIQIGVTKDGGAWAVQYWDGKVPVKEYFRSTEELNRSFAALIRAADGRNISEEWEEIVRSYGW